MTKKIFGLLFSLIIFSIIISACSVVDSISPVISPSKQFVNGIFSGNPNKAMDQICIQDGGVVGIIAINTNWGRESYEILQKTETNATVRVEGRIRASIENIDRYLEELQKLEKSIPSLDIPKLNIPKTGVGIQVNINYPNLEMKKEKDGWCVTKEGAYDFYKYIVDQLLTALD